MPSGKSVLRLLPRSWLRYVSSVCARQANRPASSARIAMDVKAVDASAIAALLFDEPEADAVTERLGNARLVAPSLLSFELANVCLIKSRRHSGQREALRKAFHLRHRLGVEEVTVDHDAILDLAA